MPLIHASLTAVEASQRTAGLSLVGIASATMIQVVTEAGNN